MKLALEGRREVVKGSFYSVVSFEEYSNKQKLQSGLLMTVLYKNITHNPSLYMELCCRNKMEA